MGQLALTTVKSSHGKFDALAQPHGPYLGWLAHMGAQVFGHCVRTCSRKPVMDETHKEPLCDSFLQLFAASNPGEPNPGSSGLP
jgi:hypothetical protein